MLDKKVEAFSEDEAQLYDRQIRLWGLEAQKRLRSARVLVIGMGGLGCEVAKNLVLAGVKSLTMMDDRNLTENDACAQFLAPRDKIGKNRAEASKERLQQLNPMVEVIAVNSGVSEKPDEFFFKGFDVVVASCLPKEILLKLDKICRENGTKFFSGDVVGFFGYSFFDLIDHEYAEEEFTKKEDETMKEPPTKKAKTDKQQQEQQEQQQETKMVKCKMSFVSLEDALDVDWSSEVYAKRIKRMDPSYFLLQVLYEFMSKEGFYPRPEKRDEDLKILRTLKEEISEKYKLPENKIQDRLLSMLFAELSPVAAIVGGVLAQEIIKAISNKDAPHNNFFLYNPLESAGIVENIA